MKKSFLALFLCLSMCLCLFAGGTTATADGSTYSATAAGFGGDVNVTITVEGDTITACEISGKNETPEKGGAALPVLQAAILESNGLAIDSISGATATSTAVKAALADCMAQAGLAERNETVTMAPGTYTGRAHGYNFKNEIIIDVTVSENEILDVELNEDNLSNYTVSDTKAYVEQAFDALTPEMLEKQSLAVDAISGATGSSNGVRAAIADALTQALTAAGTDEEAIYSFYKTVDKVSDIETLEGYDVIIVGAGAAGTSAALKAVESGAKVIMIEKSSRWGGTSMLASGPVCYNTEITEEEVANAVNTFKYGNGAGMAPVGLYGLRNGADKVWEDEAYQAAHSDIYRDTKEDVLANAIRVSGKALEMFMDHGFLYNLGYTPEPFSDITTLSLDGKAGGTMVSYRGNNKDQTPYYYENARKDFEGAGGECLLRTTVTSLLYDGDAIVGVQGSADNGVTYQVYGENVILCTGGYGANSDLMIQFTGENWGLIGAPNQGEGTLMALEAGGQPYNIGNYPMVHQRGPIEFMTVYKPEEYEGALWSPNDIPHVLSVNAAGVYLGHDGHYIDYASYKNWAGGEGTCVEGSEYYTVYSDTMLDEIRTNGLEGVVDMRGNVAVPIGRYNSQYGIPVGMPIENIYEVLDTAVDLGFVYKAETPEELDTLLSLPEGSTSDALEAAGKGTDGSTYYAIAGKGYSYSSCGGVEVNENMQVITTDGLVIDNLYLCGSDSIGNLLTTGAEYPTGGDAHMWAMSSGYLAAESATSK